MTRNNGKTHNFDISGWTFSIFASLALIAIFVNFSAAQDPFGGDPKPAKPAASPFGDDASAAGDSPADPKVAGKAAAKVESDPAVLAIEDSSPTKPDELIRAVKILINLNRRDVAKKYLIQLQGLNLDQQALADLHTKSGTGFFLKITLDEELAPEGEQIARTILKAGQEFARSSERIKKLISQLSDTEPSARRAAIVDLRSVGPVSISIMLQALSDPDRDAEYSAIRNAMFELGSDAVEPLIGALQSSDEGIRFEAANVLGLLKSTAAADHLLGPALDEKVSPELRRVSSIALLRIMGEQPTLFDAKHQLNRRVRNLLHGRTPREPDHDNMITLWSWDEEQRAVLPKKFDALIASRIEATRLATSLHSLTPDSKATRRMFLAALLESSKLLNGLDQALPRGPGSIHGFVLKNDVDTVESSLVFAMENDLTAAMIAAAEVLGDCADQSILRSANGKPRPLVQLLRHRDQRVRFRAAEAIMKLDPQQPYAGSSYLPETIEYFINTKGTRRVLVGHPRQEIARRMAGLLSELGFETDITSSMRGLRKYVATQPDYEVILVSDAMNSPSLTEIIQQFRRDYRSANLPIGVNARLEQLEQSRRVASQDPLTEAFPRFYSVEVAAFEMRQLLAHSGRYRTTPRERIQHATAALDWLVRLGEDSARYSFYDLQYQLPALESALYQAELSSQAAQVLGIIGTPSAQRLLVGLASQNTRSSDHRKTASSAFAVAVKNRGLLLTQKEIVLQYARYNQSESLDSDTQAVLGSLLDTIEQPTKLKE